jgi:CubicO group peptidase (beta-lactamase class C family)
MTGEDPIAQMLRAPVEAGEMAGAATLVWRDGEVVQSCAVGWADVEAKTPLARDSIFRIASMTKPITSVAALTLLEEGAFALNDPIARWAPEFSEMRVLRSPDGALDETDAAARPITFEDLLTHRAGITNGGFHSGPIAAAYPRTWGPTSIAPWRPTMDRGAGRPAADRPAGRGFPLREFDRPAWPADRADRRGARLGEVLQRRVFGPLGMKDTGFIVPPEKDGRRAGCTASTTPDG